MKLHVQLESELPPEVAVGRGTALFICGWCYCAEARIDSLELVVDGERQPLMAHGMPRLDPFRMLHPDLEPSEATAVKLDPGALADPSLHSYRSGFWGIARVSSPPGDGTVELSLRAGLSGGGETIESLARIPVAGAVAPVTVAWPDGAEGPRVAVAMATYEPPVQLLRSQLESIRAQTHGNWICVISDDGSSTSRYRTLGQLTDQDPRFVLSRAPRRLGFYSNFERALALVPESAQYVALADQDDIWHPDKLQALLAGLGDGQLVYSDARIVSDSGELISDTWWSRRANNHSDLLSLLVANAVTGAASLFRRDLLEYALPFPPAQFAHFHDHWIGLTALSLGTVAFVDRPLYDYVQHGDAALGHAAANRMPSLRDRVRHHGGLSDRVRMWRLHYFVDICRLMQFAAILRLRCSPSMTPGKRRTLDRFLDSDQSTAMLLRLGLRGARELLGRDRPETLGAEWMLFHALAWRRLLTLSARERPQARLRLDAIPPASLIQHPGRSGLDPVAAAVAEKTAPLRWSVSDSAPARINLLLPAIDLQHFFGGYIAKFNLARRLLERGLRVRIVTVDPNGPLPGDWRRTIESYSGLGGLWDRLEVGFGRESAAIEISRSDRFIATTWWTAHIARDALRLVDADRFLYLIQEYEPFTFPMGSYAALAAESYEFPHVALFSSELLRGYFRAHRLGVFAAGDASGEAESASFENAITPIAPPPAGELASRQTRRLLFYARPEPHAARNMYELGLVALARALDQGVFAGGWELNGIGTVARGERISLGDGSWLNLLSRADQAAYARLVREHDVGLALMYTPHPSLVPLEMASAGLLTITNCFENKTPAALAAISTNLITVAPSIEGVVDGLREAVAGAADLDRRLQGSHVNWSADWDAAFGDETLDRVLRALERTRVPVG